MFEHGIIIVGGGHGGSQLAASLRSEGYDGPLTLVTAENDIPYQRPPLSKAFLKDPAHGGDPGYPVIVDAGVGTPSDVTLAMELGSDGVLLNTGVAHARDPVAMARAMRLACESGWLGARAGRIPRKLYATASSPWEGVIGGIPGE